MQAERANFRSNLGLKIFSLLLGLAIFFAVRTEQEVSTTVGLRVVVREPADLINTSDVPGEITVRVSGSPGKIRTLDPAEIAPVVIDLTGFEKGLSNVRIREELLDLPPDLEVLSISPSSIPIRLEVKERRRLPVKPALRGTVAAGYAVGRVEVDPSFLEIEGPRRELEEIRQIRTAAVDVSGATEPVTASVVYELPPHVRIVGEGSTRAEVRVEVAAESTERTVELPVRDLPESAEVVPVRVRLRGPRPLLDSLDVGAIEARAVAQGTPGKDASYAVRIDNLPPGVMVVGPLPTVRPASASARRR